MGMWYLKKVSCRVREEGLTNEHRPINRQLANHKEISLDSPIRLYRIQIDPNFTTENKTMKVPEQTMNLGWEKAFVLVESSMSILSFMTSGVCDEFELKQK